MATEATADIAKVVRRVLDEELGEDSEAMLKGIQRVTRLLTDQVIPKLAEESADEGPAPTVSSARGGVATGTPGGKPVPHPPGGPDNPEPDEPPLGVLPEGAVEAFEALYDRLSADQSQALAAFFTGLSHKADEGEVTDGEGLTARGAAPDALTRLATRKPEAFQAAVDALTPYVAEEEDGTFSLAASKRVIAGVDADAYTALTESLEHANRIIQTAQTAQSAPGGSHYHGN